MWRASRLNVTLFRKTSFCFRTALTILFSTSTSIALNVNAANNEPLQVLTLKTAVEEAQLNDPWLVSNRHQQDSLESLSVAAGSLPDPKINLGLANLATDSFDFNQEGMTQFKVGVSQMFPRGDSLDIKKKQLEIVSSQYPLQRKNRQAEVAVQVSNIWLDAYKAQESIALIEKDRALFEQLADVAQASYSSALGKTRQQDIVRAQLELTRLDDRLAQLKQKYEMSQQQLLEWLSDGRLNDSHSHLNTRIDLSFSKQIPDIKMIKESMYLSTENISQRELYHSFAEHPAVMVFDKRISASNETVKLAKQQYKPEWGVNASYGVREDSPSGMERSDLFSIGVSFDIPLFTSNRQDKQVQSAISKASSVKTEKWLFIRKLIAAFETKRSQLIRLNQRQHLYQKRLLPQMHDQAQASLTAYTNDDGDFAEVVRSRIAELNAVIDALNIDVERQKSIIQLNYFFMRDIREITLDNNQAIRSLGEVK